MLDGRKVVITYGTFDLFHYGHQALLERAKNLGDYLIVGVTSDLFDRQRGKLNVRQSLAERMRAVMETGLADEIIIEEYRGQKVSDIEKYGVDVFAIGSDWVGKFDYLKSYCDVVYLERTRGVSSTQLRENTEKIVNLGCIGLNDIAIRAAQESRCVNGLNLVACWDDNEESMNEFESITGVPKADSMLGLVEGVDAVYISLPINKRKDAIAFALERGCHVLCEGPLFFSEADAREIFDLACEKNLIVMDACKTRYFPAFEHLRLMLQSGAIGGIRDIDASFSHVFEGLDKNNRYEGSFYDLASYVLLPAMEFLGSEYLDFSLICGFENDFCTWTKCELRYLSAAATLKAGRGIKTEGDMVITGTDGYVYVPAPWWKMDYFEIRFEDLRDTKKYFYEYAGEGHRYEFFEFFNRINSIEGKGVDRGDLSSYIAIAHLVEAFDKGDVVRLEAEKHALSGCGETVSR